MNSQVSTKIGKAKKVTNFDPDGDGFDFPFAKASSLHKNMNMLQFIRKTLLANKGKKLKQELN